MFLGLCLISAVAVVCTLAATSAKPARPTSRRRDSRRSRQRRTAYLRLHPDEVTVADLEMLLVSEGFSPDLRVWVINQVRRRDLSAPLMWRWVDRFGAARLVLAMDAQVAESSMRRHLDAHTVPDWRTFEVFAGLNSASSTSGDSPPVIIDLARVSTSMTDDFMPEGWVARPIVVPDSGPVDLSQFGVLPPIAGPGLASDYEDRTVATPGRR